MKVLLVVGLVFALANAYLVQSFRWKLGLAAGGTLLLSCVFLLFFVLQMVAPAIDWSLAPARDVMDAVTVRPFVSASYLAIGFLSILFVYAVVADILHLASWILLPTSMVKAVGHVLAFLVVVGFAVTALIGQNNAGRVELLEVDFPVRNLPAEFEGVRLAQLSDVHVGPTLRKAFVQHLCEQVAAAKPDIIVITGDLADGLPEEMKVDLEPLGKLRAPLGKFFITGNHEYYWGASLWTDAVRRLGFLVLTNENALLEKGGAQIALAGIPDLASVKMRQPPETDPLKAKQGIPNGMTSLLLSHAPKTAALAAQAGFDAQISGHTHAGQYFPFTWIIHLFEPYTHGLYKIGDLSLFVSKGVGFWGPALRTGGAGEVPVLILRKA